jgi:murein DD-endopeptidase MepM/ murein hydrolase activator NlpD
MIFRKSSYRYKNRKRQVPLLRLFILIALAFFIWNLVSKKPKQTDQSQSLNASIVPNLEPLNRKLENVFEKSPHLRFPHIVKSGETFFGILIKHDIPRIRANEIYENLKPFGLNGLFPGDSVLIEKQLDGQIKEFTLRSKNQCWYKVNWTDSLIRVEKRDVQISSYRTVINGVLETSLSEAIYKHGVSDVITGKFADIFAWDINFFTDPRKGDSFQIVFEQKFAEGKSVGYGDILAATYTTGSKSFYAYGIKEAEGNLKYYDENGKAVQKQFLKAPLRYSRISSGYTHNRRHPILGIVRPHLGIDYAAPIGTPVSAAADGKIAFAGVKGGFGKYIVLTHGGAYETQYGHLNKILVHSGQYVKQGDVIGTVGSSGLSTGPHLDYRMKRGANFVNPNTISMPSNGTISHNQQLQFDNCKNYASIAFKSRFDRHEGLHILDIAIPENNQIQVAQILRDTSSQNGISTSN